MSECRDRSGVGEWPTVWEVDDALWELLGPLLVIEKPRLKPGRPRADERRLFNGLMWLARTGSQWNALPACFGPKSTVHARFQEWIAHGKLKAAWALLLWEYDGEVGLQLEWQAADGCLIKAPGQKKGLRERRRRPDAIPPTAASAAPSATS
jgi:putative transposase